VKDIVSVKEGRLKFRSGQGVEARGAKKADEEERKAVTKGEARG
jgi:hypothetical protein